MTPGPHSPASPGNEEGKKLKTGRGWRIPCTAPSRAGCTHCRRKKHTLLVAGDAFQLAVVFTIVPVIPFTALEAQVRFGTGALATVLALFYLGYPSAFGALMWVSQSRSKVNHARRTVGEPTG